MINNKLRPAGWRVVDPYNSPSKTTISPNIGEIDKIIDGIIRDFWNDKIDQSKFTMSSSTTITPKNTDAMSKSIVFINKETNTERGINIFAVQNIKSGQIAVIISNGEEHGSKIVFNNISKNPIPAINRYLPNIFDSTIRLL